MREPLTDEQLEIARKKKNEYSKQWREKNKEAYKQTQMRYFYRKAMREGFADTNENTSK